MTRCPHCQRPVRPGDLQRVEQPANSGLGWSFDGCRYCADEPPGGPEAREQAQRMARYFDHVRARRAQGGWLQ
jgi:hypothetical protein